MRQAALAPRAFCLAPETALPPRPFPLAPSIPTLDEQIGEQLVDRDEVVSERERAA